MLIKNKVEKAAESFIARINIIVIFFTYTTPDLLALSNTRVVIFSRFFIISNSLIFLLKYILKVI